jgi:hypothetical protein
MASRSLPAATLAAIVLLAFACPAARGDAAEDAAAGPSGSGPAEAPVPADPTGGAETPGGVQALAQAVRSAVAAEADVPSAPAVIEQGPAEAPSAPPTSPPAPATTTPAPPAPQDAPATPATHSAADPPAPPDEPSRDDVARPLPDAPPSTPPKAEAAKVAPASTAPPPPASDAPPLPASTAPGPEPSAPAPTTGAPPPAPQRGNTLERLLTDADRGLREVQGQIGALTRRLRAGDLPRAAGLVRLSPGLGRIAPVLLALEARLDTAPLLSPRLKALLHRVHSRLERTQDSAGDLIAAFIRSGAGGTALRLLLRQLEHFVAFDLTPAPTPGATRGATPAPGPLGAPERNTYTAYTPIAAAPAAAPGDGVTALSPGRRGGGRHWAGQKVPGGPEHVPPSSPASASASATPGGAFFAAGMAALAALVVALALPALRVRLDLVAGRPYRAAFSSPLERPG